MKFQAAGRARQTIHLRLEEARKFVPQEQSRIARFYALSGSYGTLASARGNTLLPVRRGCCAGARDADRYRPIMYCSKSNGTSTTQRAAGSVANAARHAAKTKGMGRDGRTLRVVGKHAFPPAAQAVNLAVRIQRSGRPQRAAITRRPQTRVITWSRTMRSRVEPTKATRCSNARARWTATAYAAHVIPSLIEKRRGWRAQAPAATGFRPQPAKILRRLHGVCLPSRPPHARGRSPRPPSKASAEAVHVEVNAGEAGEAGGFGRPGRHRRQESTDRVFTALSNSGFRPRARAHDDQPCARPPAEGKACSTTCRSRSAFWPPPASSNASGLADWLIAGELQPLRRHPSGARRARHGLVGPFAREARPPPAGFSVEEAALVEGIAVHRVDSLDRAAFLAGERPLPVVDPGATKRSPAAADPGVDFSEIQGPAGAPPRRRGRRRGTTTC